MEDVLFVGTSKGIELDAVLHAACMRLPLLGVQASSGDLTAAKTHRGAEAARNDDLLDNDSCVQLSFRSVVSYVAITQFATEVVPGYSVITDPFTVAVSVWVGADRRQRLLAAAVAAAIAAYVGGRILDAEHKWSEKDLNEPEEFIEQVRKCAGVEGD